MSPKVKICLHFYITFFGFILSLLIDSTDYYLINKQYQPFSMYTNFEIYSNFNHKKAQTYFADFGQVIIKINHFADFEQVIIKITKKSSRNRIPRHFLRPLPCVTGTPPQLLRPIRVSTGSELYPDTGFFECLGIQFFNSPAPMLLTGRDATSVVTRCASAHISNLLLTKRVILVGSIYILRSPCRTLISLSPGLSPHFENPLC